MLAKGQTSRRARKEWKQNETREDFPCFFSERPIAISIRRIIKRLEDSKEDQST